MRGARRAVWLVGLVLMGTATGWAQEGERVILVEVSGTKTIANETVLAKIQTQPGSAYRDAVVSDDIRRLFALGYFTDVRADVERLPEGLYRVTAASGRLLGVAECRGEQIQPRVVLSR